MKRVFVLFSVLVISALLVTPAVAGDEKPWGPIVPGETTQFHQDIPINLVFIGYSPEQIDKQAVLDELPATYTPVVRYPPFYGVEGRDLGLKFHFAYKTLFTPEKFNDKFFRFLTKIGVPGDPTAFQLAYNDQELNVLDVEGPVLYIDALNVEKFLTAGAKDLLKMDLKRGYTIFFINWYGKQNFKFHVYTKTDEVDPDTQYNFGELRASRKMIAWGGSYGRTWFYDLSAGPEAWTDNYVVDVKDLDGNGIEDYRMPAIWEYINGGYRTPDALSADLGLVARFVGINLLFTTSPLYDPLITAPGPQGQKVTHVEMFQDDPASNGMDWINQDFIYAKLAAFEPYYMWKVNIEDNNPVDPDAQRSFRIFNGLLAEDDCWNFYGTEFAQLYCYFNSNLALYIPEYDPKDYVGEVFAFNSTDENMGWNSGLLGFADDNWVDGTQTHVFQFDTEFYRELGYGFSSTTVHEFGHHIGMSHPHDGYDPEYNIDYGPGDDFYFAWSGDESNTVMHYLALSNGFGQFDKDNMYRYEMAGYINWAAELLDDILAHPDYMKVEKLVKASIERANAAVTEFKNWNYLQAATYARLSYTYMAFAAEKLGIETESLTARMLIAPNLDVPHEGDPIRYPNN